MSDTIELGPHHGPLTHTLYQALSQGVLTEKQDLPHSHSWGMWVDLDVLACIAAENPTDDQLGDIAHLAMLLKSLEVGTPGKLEFTAQEFDELVNGFRVSCIMLLFAREGKMKKLDEKSLFDDEGTWSMTEEGKAEAAKVVTEMGLEDELDR